MKTGKLKKLNRAKTAKQVLAAIAAEGFAPFEESDIEGLSLMTLFKGRERHTARRKKADGVYIKLQSFTRAEGYEEYDFVAVSADEKLKNRGEDGKKFRPVYCKMFCKRI